MSPPGKRHSVLCSGDANRNHDGPHRLRQICNDVIGFVGLSRALIGRMGGGMPSLVVLSCMAAFVFGLARPKRRLFWL